MYNYRVQNHREIVDVPCRAFGNLRLGAIGQNRQRPVVSIAHLWRSIEAWPQLGKSNMTSEESRNQLTLLGAKFCN